MKLMMLNLYWEKTYVNDKNRIKYTINIILKLIEMSELFSDLPEA